MADLTINEEKLLKRLDEAAARARQNLEYTIENLRAEVREAGAALRDLPDTGTILRDALAVASVSIDHGSQASYYERNPSHVDLLVNGTNHTSNTGGLSYMSDGKPVRILLIVLPAKT